MVEPRNQAIESVELAVAHLAVALEHLDRIPLPDQEAVGFVAHVINNCLTVSDATLELLGDAVRGHPNPEVIGWIDGLRHLGTLMSHAAGRLLQDGAGFPLKVEPVDVGRLMARACEYYRRSALRKGLTIVYRSADGVPLAWGDRVAVAVIADNLLSNAVKFSTRDGGEISVEIQSGPGGVVCGIRDAGPGLSADEQGRLFQRGAWVGPSPTGGEPSSGYGLAIVKELVNRMGGRVWVESEPGCGACFSFSIPYPLAETGCS